jgi:hypothetical protein
MEKNIYKIGKELFITSDEEIKEGNWFVNLISKELLRCFRNSAVKSLGGKTINNTEKWLDNNKCKKIILTTDQDLIADGVQAIDNEFLEWFVKNPSCEFVEVKKGFADGTAWGYNFLDYKIIIPQEEPKQEFLEKISSIDLSPEFQQLISDNLDDLISYDPKQETFEEAAERYVKDSSHELYELRKQCFIDGLKLQAQRIGLMEIELNHTKTLLASCEKALENRDNQAERMYSEEELRKAIDMARETLEYDEQHGWYNTMSEDEIIQSLKQFKKK